MLQQFFKILFAGILLFHYQNLHGQQCNNSFSSIIYRGISFDSFTCTTTSRANEILTAGSVENDQGFVTKFSAKGTPLFSYQYYPVYQFNTTYYKTLKYSQVVQTKDGGFLLAGYAIQDKYVFATGYRNRVGVLLKTDAFGNVVWCQRFESANGFRNGGFDLSITNVLETTSGDLVVYLASFYGESYPNYGRMVCLAADGTQKWNTLLAAAYDGGLPSLETKRGMMQTRNGDVVVCDMAYQIDRRSPPLKTLAASLHLFAINPVDGKLKWETSYAYPLRTSPDYADITSALELPNGNLVFTTAFVEAANSAKKALRITTGNKGVFQSALSYQSADNSATQLLSVSTEASGNQTYLFKTGSKTILAKVNNTGSVLWARGLSNGGGLFPANCLAATTKGFGVFASNFNSRNVKLLLTDTAGLTDCANEAAQLTVEPFTLEEGIKLVTEPAIPDQNRFGTLNFPMRADAYPFEKTVECEAQSDCCNDVVDSATKPLINICEGSTYTLPDTTAITKSGVYYISYKTAGGCDSIVYYKIKVAKNPSLSLGADQCFEEKDSIVLQATEGYESYNWMNSPVASGSSFTVRKPGTYYVRVSNICGSKTDSITVYKECDFPIYVPSAFSPNGDGKNDVFGVPDMNKNNFVSLKIFNRWGQLIFNSKDAGKGWDGTVNHTPQATGIFVYYVEMKGLSGKKLSQKGTLLLVR